MRALSKSSFTHGVLSLSVLFFSTLASASTQQSLFLFSNDLKVCASDQKRYCTAAGKESFSSESREQAIYEITEEALIRVAEYSWTEQPDIKKQIGILLRMVKPVFEQEGQQLTESRFMREIRRLKFDVDGESKLGRDVWSSMYEYEKQNLFDLLEQKQASKSNRRLKTEVSLAETQSELTIDAYKRLYEKAKEIAGAKRKPRIAVITGADRDPYAKVDYYLALFNQLGFDASWISVDAAMQTALLAKQYDEKACENLQEFQIKRLASFRRQVIYPDLFKEQKEVCKRAEPFIDQLRRTDVVYIADGSALMTYHAFYTPNGEASPLLEKLLDMFSKQEITVAVEGGSINAITQQVQGVSIVSGDSVKVEANETVQYMSGGDACTLGIDCHAAENERMLSLITNKVLPLVPFGVFDHKMSREGRQLRAMHAAELNYTQYVFGVDNKTSVELTINRGEKATHYDVSVLGSGGFWIIQPQQDENAAMHFTSHYITHKDTASIRDSNVSVDFASWKIATKLQGSQPNVTSSQVFSRDNLFKLNNMLCLTGASNASGSDNVDGTDFTIALEQSARGQSRKGVVNDRGNKETLCSFTQVDTSISKK